MPEAVGRWCHRGTRAVQRIVEYAPGCGALALWAKHEDVPDGDAPAVVTDGHSLFYGVVFDVAPLPRQAGWVARGVLHIALRHPQRLTELRRRLGDVDGQLFELCAAAIVTSTLSHLAWLELPHRAVTLEQLLGEALQIEMTAEQALLEWDVERLYAALDDRVSTRPASGRRDGPRAARARALAAGHGAERMLLPAPEGPPQTESENSRNWAERLQRAHAGDGKFSMMRTLGADLPRSRRPWEQILRTQLARGLSRRRALSWSRPSRSYLANQGRCGPGRRMPFEPGSSSNTPAPRLAVIVDASGSIDTALLHRFGVELGAISRRLEVAVVLIVGDDRVRRVELLQAGDMTLDGIDFSGGGETDFEPLLAEADRHRPDIVVVLTDLEGPAGPRPHWPVIWAVPTPGAPDPPFGTRLLLV